ncbi:precorrin-6y C5,15-methyltransferase (decarboxylating) subunit CbiE [Bradyrhizobium neotropicale]|uniref:precorrin-6y C5,15-methyltransferase (decarboxylating) subunit CbiE n=1 Tax=Bradyrhizobium neotropicale TaxID=1497615 RepID=UPI001AD69AD6|nr:precorrin-6y C5,15-methyltransferase (decarboxylating) subunit CbiE [Bradyrhizobium neotropicale]MBO4221809.1 precorrin-6y C5,15-methyltransferase (decarboxylating) subunit CbiE [Bradyrhizobium neotropicale]
MADPWLTIIGIGEDGLEALSEASRKALFDAETVFGGARHLALAGVLDRGRPWPVPFDVDAVLSCRGHPTAVLASGDPFWYGVGGVLADRLKTGEWTVYPAPSTFSLTAARLGWRLESVICLGLHCAPFERLVPHLASGARIICLMRDGRAVRDLAAWLTEHGWGSSSFWTLTALGGPRERIAKHRADSYAGDLADGLLAIALEASGAQGIPRSSGLSDDLFAHDGQITKRPVRALALSALAPRPGERLWDIGAGSGSIAIEWALCGGMAIAVERREDRAGNIRHNAASFGLLDRIAVVARTAPEALGALEMPDAVFIGGGLDGTMFDGVWSCIAPGTRLVAHAVTLETEVLLAELHQHYGGELMRVEFSHARALGRFRCWNATRPIAQWNVIR